jgi:hypothetical protein
VCQFKTFLLIAISGNILQDLALAVSLKRMVRLAPAARSVTEMIRIAVVIENGDHGARRAANSRPSPAPAFIII